MNISINNEYAPFLIIHISSGIIALLSFFNLYVWYSGIETIHQFYPCLAMNPVATIGFLLFSFVMLLTFGKQEKPDIHTVRLLVMLVLFIGISELLFILGISNLTDYLLNRVRSFKDAIRYFHTSMTLTTSLNFILSGLSIYFLTGKRVNKQIISQYLALTIALISLFTLIHYLYSTDSLYGKVSNFSMPLSSAICFFLLAIVLLTVSRRVGLMQQVMDRYKGGQMARFLIPAAIVLPVALGLMRIVGEKLGLYHANFGLVLFTTANMFIFVLFIYRYTVIINRSEQQLKSEIARSNKIEQEIKNSNTFLNAVLENIPDMIFVKEATYLRFVQLNKAGEQLLGLSRNDLSGKNVYDLFKKEEADFFTKTDREVLNKKKLTDVPEEKITTAKGERWLHTKKIVVTDEEGNPLYLLGISEDITVRKAQEDLLKGFYTELEKKVKERSEELYKSEKRFRALIENCTDAISLVNGSGKVMYSSPPVLQITGYTAEEINGQSLFTIVHREDAETYRQAWNDLLSERIPSAHFIVRIRHKKEGVKWVEGLAANLLNDESVNAIIVNYHDITEKKFVEEEKQRIEKAFLHEKLKNQKKILKAALKAQEKERMELGMELHDNINQILASARMCLESAMNDNSMKDQFIKRSSDHLLLGIEEIRKLSKSLVNTAVKDGGLKNALDQLLENLVLSTSLNITFEMPGELDARFNEYQQLAVYRIVQEQVNNIIKYAEATEVQITFEEKDGVVSLRIVDNGKGFNINSKRNGIGLSNMSSRAEILNGRLDIISAEGAGCLIRLTFPLAEES